MARTIGLVVPNTTKDSKKVEQTKGKKQAQKK